MTPAHTYAFIPTGILLLFLFVLAIGVAAMILHFVREKKRREELQELARQEGWGFIEKDRDDRPERYNHYTPFGKGHTRYAYNIMNGEQAGAPFEVFDYHYAVTTHTGKSSSTTHYYHKVCVLRMPIAAASLSIQKEHIGHKLMGAVGAEDINFESDEFSRKYWVKSDDRRFAYDVIHTGMMEFLLKHPGWHWQWQGHTLLVHKKGKLGPATAKRMLKTASGFRDLLPRHLLADRIAPRPSS